MLELAPLEPEVFVTALAPPAPIVIVIAELVVTA
jgi:hypothetical protein